MYRDQARERAASRVDALERIGGLAIAGRQGRFSYIFLDRAIAEGVNATRRLLEQPPRPEAGPQRSQRPLPLEAESLVESATIGRSRGEEKTLV